MATLSHDPLRLTATSDVADSHRLPSDQAGDDQMPHLGEHGVTR